MRLSEVPMPTYGAVRRNVLESYCPVAVTWQLSMKLKLELAGKVATLRPPAANRFGHSPAPGQMAAGEPDAVQAVTVQLDKPVLGVSLAIAPLAAVAPVLLKVTVYCVVLPATKVVVPLVLVTSKAVEQAVVRVVLLPNTVNVPVVANQGSVMPSPAPVPPVRLPRSTPVAPPVTAIVGAALAAK